MGEPWAGSAGAEGAVRRRIAVLSDAHGYSGAEMVLTSLVAAWGPTCDVVAVVPDGSAELNERLAAAGATLLSVPGLNRHCGPRVWQRTAHMLTQAQPDQIAVNLTDQGDGAALLYAARRASRRSVALLHLWIPNRTPALDRLSAGRLRKVAAVATPSEATAELVKARGVGATSIQVAPGRVPIRSRDEARELLGLAPGDIVVGGIGRLAEHKGWDLLISAAERVHAARPEVRFAVVGDGSWRDKLVRLDAGGHIDWIGAVPDAGGLIKAFDVIVLPSRYEGLPLVAIESAFAGVPVVAADVTGLREAVGDSDWLVPADDPDALATALLAALSDMAELARRGAMATARAESRFTVAGMVGRIDELLAPQTQAELCR